MLDEPFFKVDILGILLVIIGSTLAVIFGPRTAGGTSSMKDLEIRWADRDFFIFFVVLSSITFVDFLGVKYYERLNFNSKDVNIKIKYGSTFLLLSYCLLAGYFGSNAFLFLKSFTEFIGSSISSKKTANQNLTNWYVIILYLYILSVTINIYKQYIGIRILH